MYLEDSRLVLLPFRFICFLRFKFGCSMSFLWTSVLVVLILVFLEDNDEQQLVCDLFCLWLKKQMSVIALKVLCTVPQGMLAF